MTDTPIFAVNTLPSPPDQRDIPFIPKVWPPSAFAPALDLMPDVEEVEDQLSLGSCVANGVVEACEMLAKKAGKHVDLSRMFLYTATLDAENRLGEEGLVPRDAYKVAYKYGLPLEADYPYDLSKSTVRPTDEAYLTASNMRVKRYEAVVAPHSTLERQEKIDRIKSALNEKIAVDIALLVTESIRHLAGPWRSEQYQLVSPTSVDIGGHFMRIIGYDDSCGLWLVQNSWGPEWGDGGFCGLPYALVDQPFFEAWLIRNFNGWEIPEAPGIKLESMTRFHIEARIVAAPADIGKTVKVWLGGVNNGKIYLRAPVAADQLANPTTIVDNWLPQTGNDWPASADGVLLGTDNKVVIVNWMNLAALAGTDVYVAYGETGPLDWTLQKLCTVPNFS